MCESMKLDKISLSCRMDGGVGGKPVANRRIRARRDTLPSSTIRRPSAHIERAVSGMRGIFPEGQ